jgi:hypothetical protein
LVGLAPAVLIDETTGDVRSIVQEYEVVELVDDPEVAFTEKVCDPAASGPG